MKSKNKIKNLKVSSTMQDVKSPKVERNFVGLQLLLISANLIGMLLVKNVFYIPEERDLLTDNLFENSEVVISIDEQQQIYREIEKELGIKISDNNTNYLLLNAIYDNPYLNSKEKEIFYKFIEYFNDNPYLNLEEVYENLLNVNARFALRKPLGASEDTLALYLPDYLDIIYFELFPSDITKAHEGVHSVMRNYNIPRWLNEGMSQLITNEYFKEAPFSLNTSYPFELALVKLMCEIVGTDTVLKAYTEDNVELIYEALSNISGTKEEAKVMLEYFDMVYNSQSNEPILKTDLYKYLEQILKYMSEEEMKENPGAVYNYLMLSSVLVDEADEFIREHILCKAYLSSSLKEKGYSEGILMTNEEYGGNPYQK